MNRYEIWAPWFVLACGFFLGLIGILCMGLAWGHYANVQEEAHAVSVSALRTLAVVDQCAAQVERMQDVITGPLVPRVVAPPIEVPFLGRGG